MQFRSLVSWLGLGVLCLVSLQGEAGEAAHAGPGASSSGWHSWFRRPAAPSPRSDGFQKAYEGQWAVVSLKGSEPPLWESGYLIATQPDWVTLRTSSGKTKSWSLSRVSQVQLLDPEVVIYDSKSNAYRKQLMSPKSTADFAALVTAIQNHDAREVARLAPLVPDIDSHRFSLGDTVLCMAARWGDGEAVRALAQAHAKLTETCAFQEPLLHVAAAHRNWKTFEALLAAGADVNQPSTVRVFGDEQKSGIRTSSTPLMLVASSDEQHEIVDSLLAHHALADFRTGSDGRSALSVAAMNGAVRNVDSLLAHGAEINQRDDSGYTPLMHAAANLQVEMVEHLVAKGAQTAGAGRALNRIRDTIQGIRRELARSPGQPARAYLSRYRFASVSEYHETINRLLKVERLLR